MTSRQGTSIQGWAAAAVLALLWGVGPALPALFGGDLIGHPYTDLYPSVWGLWEFARSQPDLHIHTELLGFPDGLGYYYSSPIKGWVAAGLMPLVGLTATWNLLTVLARVATVVCAFGAARAWGLSAPGALTVAGAWGCAPFFHGYAVEGIVEGTDGWTLALWAWAAGHRRPLAAAFALGLTILSSWYLGAVGCLLALLSVLRDRRMLLSLGGGLLLAAPAIGLFLFAFPASPPLPDDIRAAMGATLRVPAPGIRDGLQPFAINAYIGWLLAGTAAVALWNKADRPLIALAAVPAVLSLGIGPWYQLPVLEMLRFPYRWHAATLALLALAAGRVADRRRWWWLGPLIALEGLLLSPVEPLLPGADPTVPAIYQRVDGPLVEAPGPVTVPPGEVNHSRPRARYLLYFQTMHGQPSPWVLDFNGLGDAQQAPHLSGLRGFDRLEDAGETWETATVDIQALHDAGIEWMMIQHSQSHTLGSKRARRLRALLEDAGATVEQEDDQRWLIRLPLR
ncbi:MAG: hypothetical protein AAFV53_32285 [Myxococcota bacterium]